MPFRYKFTLVVMTAILNNVRCSKLSMSRKTTKETSITFISRCHWCLLLVNVIPSASTGMTKACFHDDVIKWKHFPRYWTFVRGIHRSPVNSPHKGQWRGALMFSLICVWINGWVNNREAGDLRRYRAHYDVTVMFIRLSKVSASEDDTSVMYSRIASVRLCSAINMHKWTHHILALCYRLSSTWIPEPLYNYIQFHGYVG